MAPGAEFDLLWIDLGAAHRIEGFFEAWWPRVRPEGGMVREREGGGGRAYHVTLSFTHAYVRMYLGEGSYTWYRSQANE